MFLLLLLLHMLLLLLLLPMFGCIYRWFLGCYTCCYFSIVSCCGCCCRRCLWRFSVSSVMPDLALGSSRAKGAQSFAPNSAIDGRCLGFRV